MNSTRTQVSSRRRWVTAAIGLGTPAVALATAAMIGVGTAPAAHADPFSDIVNNVENSLIDAGNYFTDVGTDLAAGSPVQSVSDLLAGINTGLFSVPDDLIVGGAQLLTGSTIGGPFAFDDPVPPVDLSDALTNVGNFLNFGGTDLGDALTALLSLTPSGFAYGVDQGINGLNLVLFSAPDELILGLLVAVGL